jgi:osmotically-inducible protein OsmY
MHRIRRNTRRGALGAAFAALLALPALAATPPENADRRISTDVRDAIFHHAEFAGDDISVQTHDGVVYLHGVVDTNVERDAAEKLAQATPGVKRVVNALELRNIIR